MSIISNTLLIVFFGAVGVGALLTYVFREPLARLRRYFHAWSQQDEQAKLDAERDAALRERAEAELHRELHGVDDDLRIGL